jgi:hypothetical protein
MLGSRRWRSGVVISLLLATAGVAVFLFFFDGTSSLKPIAGNGPQEPQDTVRYSEPTPGVSQDGHTQGIPLQNRPGQEPRAESSSSRGTPGPNPPDWHRATPSSKYTLPVGGTYTLHQLFAASDLVFLGTLAKMYCFRDRDGAIKTSLTYETSQIFKGDESCKEVEFAIYGGKLPSGEAHYIVEMPEFMTGDTDIVFLIDDRRLYCPIAGWHQGRFKVVDDETTGRRVVMDYQGHCITHLDQGTIRRHFCEKSSAISLQTLAHEIVKIGRGFDK